MKLNMKLKSQTRAHSHARALHHTDSNGLLPMWLFGVSMPFLITGPIYFLPVVVNQHHVYSLAAQIDAKFSLVPRPSLRAQRYSFDL